AELGVFTTTDAEAGRIFMKSTGMLTLALSVLTAGAGWCQILPPAGLTQGPGVQAPRDSRYANAIKACKTPPPAARPQAAPAPAGTPALRRANAARVHGDGNSWGHRRGTAMEGSLASGRQQCRRHREHGRRRTSARPER